MGFTKPSFLHRQINKNRQISTPWKTSEIRAKQKEKEEVKH